MTTLGIAFVAAGCLGLAWGIRWAWVNVAVVDTLYSFEDDQATVDAEFAALVGPLEGEMP